MINIITNHLPETVKVKGITAPVALNTDFRCGIQVLSLFDQPDVDAATRNLGVFVQYYGNPNDYSTDVIAHYGDMIAAALDFLHMEELAVVKRKGSPKTKRTFDWDIDQRRIVSDFQREYGIDLTSTATKLHWWRFLALLDGLTAKSNLAETIRLRMMKIPAGASGEDKSNLRRAKKLVALPLLSAAEAEEHERAMWGDE